MITIETRTGKRAYETVAERVKKFRTTFPVDSGWQLLTEIDFPSGDTVLCRAKIIDPEGRLVATGTAEETRGSSFINKTSAVENAETSAIGRALFAAGFGGGEFCSADELMTAMKRQEDLISAEHEARRAGVPVYQEEAGLASPSPADRTDADFSRPPASSFEEMRLLSPEAFGLPEDCGIEFVQESRVIYAKDRRKGATFSNRTALKNAGFSFDGQNRVWFKRSPAAEEAA